MKIIKLPVPILKRKLIRFITFVSALILPIGLFSTQVFASGLNDLKVASSVATVSTITTLTVTWTNRASYTTGDTFVISIPAVTGTTSNSTSFAQNSLANTDVSTTAPAAYSSAVTTVGLSGGFLNITVTVPASTTTASGTSFSMTVGGTNKLKNPTTAGNFQVNLSSTLAGGSADYGAGIVSVGGANQIAVTATVSNTLSFTLRDSADTTSATTCSLGSLSTASISNCQYRLKVGTNAQAGFTVSYVASGGLTNGTSTLTPLGTGEATPGNAAIGTEGYGANIQAGAVTVGGSTTTSSKPCSTNCTTTGNTYQYQNTSTPVNIYTSNKGNSPASTDTTNTALVTHVAAISATSPAGNFTQTITYSAVAAF